MVFEIVDNCIDEALAGHCTHIEVFLLANGSVKVVDNGRGIPCEPHPTTGKSTLETVLCVLHAGGKFGGDESGYKISGGLHGVGLSVVNALSSSLVAEVVRDGFYHRMDFSKGVALGPMKKYAANTLTMSKGTTITFEPDPIIFKSTTKFDLEKISTRIDELAYLNPGLVMTVVDERESGAPANQIYRHDGGISELVTSLCESKGGAEMSLHQSIPVITMTPTTLNGKPSSAGGDVPTLDGAEVEVAMSWTKNFYSENIIGFANGIRTNDGGTHIEGFRAAVAKTLNAHAKSTGKLREGASSIPGEFFREGMTAVVSVKVPEPEFEGQTKSRLGNPEIRTFVDATIKKQLSTFLEWNVDIANALIRKALDAQAASNAAKAARDMVRGKSSVSPRTILPGKLSDCSSRDPSECEIFVVEGDSAAGSAKQGRDRRTQAILPLRGKVLNIEKTSEDKISKNTELQALISALGLGIGPKSASYNLKTLRYHRIVLMTDADVDGSHIRLLLLTFLYRYQRKLVDNGHVYIACPPLYKVIDGRGKQKVDKYFYSKVELDEHLRKIPVDQHPSIQRFKGLGEMMPQQLWDTTMDPMQRRLKKITVADIKACDDLFSTLMGNDAKARREFIIQNSSSINTSDLDV